MAEEWLLFQKVDLPHRRFCLPAVSLWPNLCGCCDCKNVNWEISSLASISYFLVFFCYILKKYQSTVRWYWSPPLTCSWLLPPWLSPDYHHGLGEALKKCSGIPTLYVNFWWPLFLALKTRLFVGKIGWKVLNVHMRGGVHRFRTKS